MTKKDYIKIASIFRVYVTMDGLHGESAKREQIAEVALLKSMAISFCRMLKIDNDRFDRARFMVACGLTQQEKTS